MIKKKHKPLVESLEGRRMLSAVTWSTQAKQIGLDQAAVNYPTINGAGESIAMIDTGVDYNNANMGGGFGAGHKVVAGYDFIDNDADPFCSTNAHGAGTASTAAANPYTVNGLTYQGVAPGADIIALRATTTDQVKEALDWVIANRAKYNIVAVNMIDWGGDNPQIYHTELATLYSNNVFIGSPSGNNGPGVPAGEAIGHYIFQTGSVNASNNVSTFTQRGVNLDMLAPGENVMIDTLLNGQSYEYWSSGTSFASPQVVAAAALLHQVNPNFTVAQEISILQTSGTKVYDPTSNMTYSELNVNAAIRLAYQESGFTAPNPSNPVPPPVVSTTPPPVVSTPAPTPAPGTRVSHPISHLGRGMHVDHLGRGVHIPHLGRGVHVPHLGRDTVPTAQAA